MWLANAETETCRASVQNVQCAKSGTAGGRNIQLKLYISGKQLSPSELATFRPYGVSRDLVNLVRGSWSTVQAWAKISQMNHDVKVTIFSFDGKVVYSDQLSWRLYLDEQLLLIYCLYFTRVLVFITILTTWFLHEVWLNTSDVPENLGYSVPLTATPLEIMGISSFFSF